MTNHVSLQITKSFFSAVNETVQQKLLSVMFDLLVENPSPLVAVTISSVFKRVSRESWIVNIDDYFNQSETSDLKAVNHPAL